MDRSVLREIATQLERYASKQGGKLVVDEHSAEVDPLRFQLLGAPNSIIRGTVIFVDGGQATLLESPTFLLQFVRVAAVTYQGQKRVCIERKEAYTLTTLAEKEGQRMFVTSVFPAEEEMDEEGIRLRGIEIPDIAQDDPTLKSGMHAVTPQQVGLVVRKLLELDLMDQVCKRSGAGTLVVRDGDLVPRASCELGGLQTIYNHVGRGILVVGLSKTTHAFTTTGSAATSALLRLGPSEPWYYPHHAQGLVDVGFVKLHEKSAYAFRLDTVKDAGVICGILSLHASDPVFRGYPYGLVQADEFGRVSHKEQEGLLLTFMHAAQEKYPLLVREMRSLDAHSILDRIKA